MPEPNPQVSADAYSYCSLDRNFEDKANRREAVKQYVRITSMLDDKDDNEKDDFYREVEEYAAKWTRIKKLNEKVDAFKNFVLDRLPMIGKSKCLSDLSGGQQFLEAVTALKTTAQQLTFKVSRDVTQNAGGTISISVLEDPKNDAEEAILFALAHELGHSADLTLNPYNKSDRSYPDIHRALCRTCPSPLRPINGSNILRIHSPPCSW